MFSASFRLVAFVGIFVAFHTAFAANIPPRSKASNRNGSVNRRRLTDSFSSVSITRSVTTSDSLDPLPFIEELDVSQNLKITGENVDMYEGSANSFDLKEEFTSSVNPQLSTTGSLQHQHIRTSTGSSLNEKKHAIHPLEWLFFHSSTTQRPSTQTASDQNLRFTPASLDITVTDEPSGSLSQDHPRTSTQPYMAYTTKFTVGSKNESNKFYSLKMQNSFSYAKPNATDPNHHAAPSIELEELAEALQKVTSLLHKLSQQSDKELKDKVSAQIVGTLLAVNTTKELSSQSTPLPPYVHPTTSTLRSTTTLPTTTKPLSAYLSSPHDQKHFQPSIQLPEDIFLFRNDTWLDPYYFPVNPYYLASANPPYYETSTQTPPPTTHQPQIDKNDVVNQGVSLSLTSITDKLGVLGNLFNSLRQQTPEGKQQLFLTIMVGIPMITAFLAALGVSQLILAPIAMVIPFYLMMTFADSNVPKRQKRSSPTMQYVEVPGWDELIHIINCLQGCEQFSSGGWAKLDT